MDCVTLSQRPPLLSSSSSSAFTSCELSIQRCVYFLVAVIKAINSALPWFLKSHVLSVFTTYSALGGDHDRNFRTEAGTVEHSSLAGSQAPRLPSARLSYTAHPPRNGVMVPSKRDPATSVSHQENPGQWDRDSSSEEVMFPQVTPGCQVW